MLRNKIAKSAAVFLGTGLAFNAASGLAHRILFPPLTPNMNLANNDDLSSHPIIEKCGVSENLDVRGFVLPSSQACNFVTLRFDGPDPNSSDILQWTGRKYEYRENDWGFPFSFVKTYMADELDDAPLEPAELSPSS